MRPRTLVVVLAVLLASATVAGTAVPTACGARGATVSRLSRSSTLPGASLIIRGSHFGARKGASFVTFGERPNILGFAPCAKKARVVHWSGSAIKVVVPGMAPGSHRVYVTVAGKASKSLPFSIEPRTVIRDRTFSTAGTGGNVLPSRHDVLYVNCTFTAGASRISGMNTGVLCLGQDSTTHYNATFRDCTFTGNMGEGSGPDYGVNGIKLVDVDNSVHDITFQNCHIGAVSRMGFEAITAGSERQGLTNIALIKCTFEPSGAEPISFGSQGAVYSLVDGCVLKGYGNLAEPQYGAGFEANQATHIMVRNTQIWAGQGAAVNISGPDDSRCNLLFQNVDIDMSHLVQKYPTNYGARLFGCGGMNHSVWRNCTFNTGDAANHCYNAGWAENGDGWATCANNDFSSCKISGEISAETYWDAGVPASNVLPTVVR